MPQGAIPVATAGTSNNWVEVTAAAVVKATPGRVGKIVIGGVVGTGGNLTVNDCATVAAATTGNQIFTTAGTVAVGTVIDLSWPCKVGIVVSAVPTGGTVRIPVSFA